jgi:glyoxylase-like metal-dependent hydrolase (beta-lactamase superfamily II)
MRLSASVLAALLCAACATSMSIEPGDWRVIAGGFEPGRGPDGNSVFLDAPSGLILVDTGRHPAHQDALLAYARARRQPIAAIVNTHWHLDHSGGNAEIRAAFPRAELHASRAIEGALTGFFPQSRASTERYLAGGGVSAARQAEIRRDFAAMDDPASLRATRPIDRSGRIRIAGRPLNVHLARFAATEGDIWIHDDKNGLVIAGDLVVAMVPFMDTACPEGWRKALDEIAATPFRTLVPGHGETMTRSSFLDWRSAFNNLLDCGASARSREACIAGWKQDAAAFIPEGERRVDEMVGYYIDTRLRASPEERGKYCRPLH